MSEDWKICLNFLLQLLLIAKNFFLPFLMSLSQLLLSIFPIIECLMLTLEREVSRRERRLLFTLGQLRKRKKLWGWLQIKKLLKSSALVKVEMEIVKLSRLIEDVRYFFNKQTILLDSHFIPRALHWIWESNALLLCWLLIPTKKQRN